MGSGEYVVELAGESAAGHFGLAVRDYTHATFQGLDVGHRLRVQLTRTDVESGYIDFTRVG